MDEGAAKTTDAGDATPLRDRALETMDAVEASELERDLAAAADADGTGANGASAAWIDGAVDLLIGALSDADAGAARRRAEELRGERPDAPPDELVEALIARTVRTTAAIGAATSGAASVPVIGTLTSLTVGVAADIAATLKAQAEMVLAIAALYDHPLDSIATAQIVFLVTGFSGGGNALLKRSGASLGTIVGQRLARRWLAKALPVIGVVASGGTNALSSFVIGRRAQAYFRDGPEAVGDWRESVRRLSGVDERRVAAALADGGQRTLDAVLGAAGTVAQGVRGAGEATLGAVGNAAESAAAGVAEGANRVARGGRALAARLPGIGPQDEAGAAVEAGGGSDEGAAPDGAARAAPSGRDEDPAA